MNFRSLVLESLYNWGKISHTEEQAPPNTLLNLHMWYDKQGYKLPDKPLKYGTLKVQDRLIHKGFFEQVEPEDLTEKQRNLLNEHLTYYYDKNTKPHSLYKVYGVMDKGEEYYSPTKLHYNVLASYGDIHRSIPLL